MGCDKLKIGYVLAAFPIFSETFIGNEMRAMAQRGHEFTPLVLGGGESRFQPGDKVLAVRARRVHALNLLHVLLTFFVSPLGFWRAWIFARQLTGIRPRSAMLSGAKIATFARRLGCLHLHAHFAHCAATAAIIAARINGITVSFTAHGYDFYGSPSDLRLKLDSSELVFAVCDDMAKNMKALTEDATIVTVHCGIDPARFKPVAQKKYQDRLLLIGRLVEQKGIHVLIEALSEMDAADRPAVDIVGDGPWRIRLENKARRSGVDCIRFLGARNSDWIAWHGPRYRALLAPFVICADGDRDTGPVVAKEAMAMGLPVIASRLMGLIEIVTPETGWLVNPDDRHVLAAAIHAVMTAPPDEMARRGMAGRARIESCFTLDRQATKISTEFERLIERQSRGSAATFDQFAVPAGRKAGGDPGPILE